MTRAALEAERQRHRREALDLSDTVVQGLAVARHALERNKALDASAAIEKTLATAQKVVTELLADLAAESKSIAPGDLVRARPGTLDLDARDDEER